MQNDQTALADIQALITQGKLAEADQAANALLEFDAANAQAWNFKGVACSRLGDKNTAIASFNHALKFKPDFALACLNLGRTLQEVGQLPMAIQIYQHWLTIEQLQADKKNPLAITAAAEQQIMAFFQEGDFFQHKGEFEKAAMAFRKALGISPDLPEALINLGVALYSMRRFAEAEEALLKCIKVSPGHTHALIALGGNYFASGQLPLAIAVWRYILVTDPHNFDACLNIAKAFSMMKDYSGAISGYEQAIGLRPQHSETLIELLHMLAILCRWERIEEIRLRLQKATHMEKQGLEPFLMCIHLPELQLENARRYVQKHYPAAQAYDSARRLPADVEGRPKLRIGYLSSDFHAHATAYLMSEMFEQHDKARFEIIGFSYGQDDGSDVRRRIIAACDQFHDLRQIDNLAADQLIRNAGIDILVDLKAYTAGTRFGLLAQRPAPLQIHYLGQPGTTGANFIDYFIADAIAAPEGADADFSECLIRLPHSYQINDRTRPLPQQALPRSAYGLPEQGFVFCDFNNAYKITPDVFAVWMRLLNSVPGSVLWLYETDAEATINLRAEAKKRGIDPARIITASFAPLAQHLARYLHADLMIDTFPCNGHTTTSDALWCGVPVVTLAGKSFVSRVSASLLQAVGLPQLICEDIASYEALALKLAREKEKLAGLRQYLQEVRMRCVLFDSAATTRAIEEAYMRAAELHRSGKPPEAFAITE